MIDIVKKNISSFAKRKKEEAVRICLYFSGDMISSFLLKTLLENTRHQVCLYYIDKRKYEAPNGLSAEDINKEGQSKMKIIEFFDGSYKRLTCEEMELFHDDARLVAEIDDIRGQVSILDRVYDLFGGFDAYAAPLTPEKLENSFELFELHSLRRYLRNHPEFVFPFLSLKQTGFYAEIIVNLFQYIINFDKIYNDNKPLINALVQSDKTSEINKRATFDTDFDVVFRYLAAKKYTRCSFLLENYGDKISPKLYRFALLHHIPWHYSNEKLIALCVDNGKITDSELNSILISFVARFDSKANATTEARLKELDYFFRLFEHRISNETMDRLMIRTQWVRWHNAKLLDKLAELGGDVGELLIYCMRMFFNDEKKLEERAGYLLDNHSDKIHELQLNEALIMAFTSKLFRFCERLIEKGAARETLRFHKSSHGMARFNQENPYFIANRNYWRAKDIIVVKQILKHLGNPQKKVPPVIHVTGSNGKGSTCAYLRAILEQTGRKVHMFTSPALVRSNENFIISSEEISDEMYYGYLTRAAEAYRKAEETEEFQKLVEEANAKDRARGHDTGKDGVLHWSVMIPAIIMAFTENPADASIVEVIAGGERDLSNVFDGQVTAATVVNTIIFGDNHAALWKNIEETALTKAGLCKENGLLICGSQENTALDAIIRTARDRNCRIASVDNHDWRVEDSGGRSLVKYDGCEIVLKNDMIPGQYQRGNLALAYVALLSQDKIPISREEIQTGLARNRNMLGRMKLINDDRNYRPFLEKHMPENFKVFLGTVKEKYGMADFISYLKRNFPDRPAHFVVNIPSTSERVLSMLDILRDSGLNIKSVVIFDSLKGKDRDVLRQRATSLNSLSVKIVIKSSISGALASSLSIIKKEGHRDSLFTLLTAGIQIFPKIIIYLLYSAYLNPNYEKDLEFARQSSVLKEEELAFYD